MASSASSFYVPFLRNTECEGLTSRKHEPYYLFNSSILQSRDNAENGAEVEEV